jgi:ankyrin repeat protein
MDLARLSIPFTGEAFLESAKKSDVVALKLLLRAGIDPGTADPEGITALMYAARNGNKKVVDLLLNAGADVNQRNRSKGTALGWAVSGGQLAIMSALLDGGADQDAIDRAFYSAALVGNLACLRLLFERDNAKTKAGDPAWAQQRLNVALREAADGNSDGAKEDGLLEVARFLLEQGANVNEPDKDGWTPLTRAIARERLAMVRLLLDRGAAVNGKCACGNFDVQVHLATDKTLHNGVEWTPLLMAASRRSDRGVEMIQLLLAKGADVNQQNGLGETPLMMAAADRLAHGVKPLLDKGANVNLRDHEGRTALMQAARSESLEGVCLLLEHGAAVNARDAHGKTALKWVREVAESWGQQGVDDARNVTRIVQALTKAGAR